MLPLDEFPLSAKVNIPRVRVDAVGPDKGPFTIDGLDGFFPALCLSCMKSTYISFQPSREISEDALIPLPGCIIPIKFSQPHRIKNIVEAIRHAVPLVSYVVADEDLSPLPDKIRNFGCLTYVNSYEITSDDLMLVELEHDLRIKVIAEKDLDQCPYVRVQPLVDRPSSSEEDTQNSIEGVIDALLGKHTDQEITRALLELKNADSSFQVTRGPYIICQLLRLPAMVRLNILSNSEISERIRIIEEECLRELV